MEVYFEIIQIIEALGIILFSLVSVYYGIRILRIHILVHKRILKCCWITLIQTISQLLFATVYVFILWQLLIKGTNVFDPLGVGSMFIRPIIFINNLIIAIYLKIRFITDKNSKLVEEVNGG